MEIQLVISLIFVFAAKSFSETVSITPPALVKKNQGDNCKLQWIVSGTFFNYSIMHTKDETSKNLDPLGPQTDTDYDRANGIITLNIWDVQTQDAGYYVLTLNTGSQPSPSSNSVLFVYGNFRMKIVGSSNSSSPSQQTEFTEGDVIDLDCTVTSYFTPPGFQIKMYYSWYDGYSGYLQNTSGGPAITLNGDAVAGYSLKNNGQILFIDTSRIVSFSHYYRCQVIEEGSLYASSKIASNKFTLNHRPFIYDVDPPSLKWNAISSFGYADFIINIDSNPSLSSSSNWSFIGVSGTRQELPLTTNILEDSWTNLTVPQNEETPSYGNYTLTLRNTKGSISITIQLIPPAGVPDMPGDFKVRYVTHSVVSLQWRCGWHNGEPQAVTVNLTNAANNTIVETSKTSLAYNYSCYNWVFTSTFQSIVIPDTDYVASIWATNIRGRSRVATLMVRTPVKPTFSVSYEDISFTESTAIVNVATSVVDVWLNVSCCVEAKAQCVLQSMTLHTSQNQIVIDPIPIGDDYVFDFVLFNRGFNYTYSLALIKGLKKSRNTSGDTIIPCNTANENKSLLIAVIVLAILLGVSALIIIICLIVNLRSIRHNPTDQNEYEQEVGFPSSANNLALETDSEPIPYASYDEIIGDEEYDVHSPLDENPPPMPSPIPMQIF